MKFFRVEKERKKEKKIKIKSLLIELYHETIHEELDSAVAEGGGGELKITKVATEDTGRQRHGVVDQVDEDRRCRKP